MFQTDPLNLQFLKRKSIKEKFSGENFSLLVVDNVRRFLLELSCKMLTILLHSEHFACPFELVRGLTLDLISSLGFLVVVVPAPHINNTHRNRNNYNNTVNTGV